MFIEFFFYLRSRGIKVSLNEWMTLLEALEKGLHHSSLTGFYHLCRAILIHDESEFDRFDQAFLEFFKDVEYPGEIPKEFMDRLNHPIVDVKDVQIDLEKLGIPPEDMEDILAFIQDRLKRQNEEHNGGNTWIGTHGYTPAGNSGWHPHGIRIGGRSKFRTARAVAGERKYRDFRKDNTLDTRSFQMAFRTLRSLSAKTDTQERELDVDATVRATGDKGGILDVRYRPPRKNTIKVLLLMDSGGSIEDYANLCSMLFQAAVKSNNFKELHTYYFHNCIFDHVYSQPDIRPEHKISVEWMLKQYGPEYRVIVVGDAMMDPYELHGRDYNWAFRTYSDYSGYDTFLRIVKAYPHCVWLNPEKKPAHPGYWYRTYEELEQVFPMYHLSQEGLEAAMHRLMQRS